MSSDPSYEWKPEFHDGPVPQGFDVAQMSNLDMATMKERAVQGRREWVEECLQKSALPESRKDFATFEKGLQESERAHQRWLKLPEPRPRGVEHRKWLADEGYALAVMVQDGNWELPEIGELSLSEWIDAAPAMSSFAVLLDGKWYERGEMGWWACVSNERDDWDAEFDKLFASLRDDQWIAVLDCHI